MDFPGQINWKLYLPFVVFSKNDFYQLWPGALMKFIAYFSEVYLLRSGKDKLTWRLLNN